MGVGWGRAGGTEETLGNRAAESEGDRHSRRVTETGCEDCEDKQKRGE